MIKQRWLIALGMGAFFLISMLFGMYVYKSGLHYRVLPFYYSKYRDAPEPIKYTFPEDLVNRTIPNNNCGCPRIKENKCPCKGSNFSAPEKPIIKALALLSKKYVKDYESKVDFPSYLRIALGMNNLHPSQASGGASISVVKKQSYRGGKLAHLNIHFSKPKIHTEALYAQHINKPENIVLIIHGHTSNMYKVAGLDVPDYMRGAGAHWFDKGSDTISFNTTNSGGLSGTINRMLLSNYGAHVSGLWVRSICDTVNALKLREKYKKIYVYGISNGGRIADYISVVCKPFNLVVVGDIFSDWRLGIMQDPEPVFGQEYSLYYNRPIYFDTSYVDYFKASNSRKVYTRNESWISMFPFSSVKTLKKIPISKNNKVSFLYKKHRDHIVELKLIDDLIADDWDDIKGFSVKIDPSSN